MENIKFTIKSYLLPFIWFLNKQLYLHPKKIFHAFYNLPKYLLNYIQFRKSWHGQVIFKPCLHDWNTNGGDTNNEYFLQDLIISKKIYQNSPVKHVDIGSRIDGFVAHVASFREIEVFDIRPINSIIPGIIFKQADFMDSHNKQKNYCDSLSCLHALEHFGLGRYGDPINPYGYKKALEHMATLLKTDGIFYLSVPIGQECIEFNAHRIFDPINLIEELEKFKLKLIELVVIKSDLSIQKIDKKFDIEALSKQRYLLGLFTLKKII